MLERQHLQILKAIALEGNGIQKPATDLFLTQSSLSHAVKIRKTVWM